MKRRISPIWLVIFAVFMVSYSGPMIKGALGCGASPITIAFLRMILSAAILGPFDLLQCKRKKLKLRLSLKEEGKILLAAVFLALHYYTWMTSLAGTSTFASVALVCTQPLFVSLLSYLLFHEKTPRKALPGALLALIGAVVIALGGLTAGASGGTLLSDMLALAGALMMAAHWLCNREVRRTVEAEVCTPRLYLYTAILLWLMHLGIGPFACPVSALPWIAGLVIGCTVLGHAVFTYALAGVSATVVSFALLGEPVGAMIFSMFLFGEIPTPMVIAGGLLTLMGLALYLAKSGSEKEA